MFPNLRAEMARHRLSIKDLAACIGVSENAFRNRLAGKTEFTMLEIVRIKRAFFKNLSLDYLFDTTGTVQAEAVTDERAAAILDRLRRKCERAGHDEVAFLGAACHAIRAMANEKIMMARDADTLEATITDYLCSPQEATPVAVS